MNMPRNYTRKYFRVKDRLKLNNIRRIRNLPLFRKQQKLIKARIKWLCGFLVGDGYFTLFVKHGGKSGKNPSGKRIMPRLVFSQKDKDFSCLFSIQKFLKKYYAISSTIYVVKDNSHADNLYVEGYENIIVLVEAFIKTSLIGPKAYKLHLMYAYLIKYYRKKLNLKKEGVLGLIDARKVFVDPNDPDTIPAALIEKELNYTIGESKDASLHIRKQVRKKMKNLTLNYMKRYKKKTFNLDPEFICGIFAAEGYFRTSIFLAENGNAQIRQAISITGSINERFVLKMVAEHLGDENPRIYKVKDKQAYTYICRRQDHIQKIINFFNKNPFYFHVTKQKQFETFRFIQKSLSLEKHKTKKGFLDICFKLYNTPTCGDHKSRKHTLEELQNWSERLNRF
jgi:hypothetical protein